MTTVTADQEIQTLQIIKEELIDAPIEISFQAMLDELGPEGQMPDGKSLSLKLEPWPGGRWFRDLGNNTGHFWGHVQVIKPPKLLEICGPMAMSYPAINHFQYRLTVEGAKTRLTLTHKAIGFLPQEHRDGMPEGWEQWLKAIRKLAERRHGAKRDK
jgi:uncharacterized protein YndB with AHSA1/START domain